MSILRKLAGRLKPRTFSKVKENDPSALRGSEVDATKKEGIIKQLKKGERSGFLADFDGEAFLKDLHRKHARKG